MDAESADRTRCRRRSTLVAQRLPTILEVLSGLLLDDAPLVRSLASRGTPTSVRASDDPPGVSYASFTEERSISASEIRTLLRYSVRIDLEPRGTSLHLGLDDRVRQDHQR